MAVFNVVTADAYVTQPKSSIGFVNENHVGTNIGAALLIEGSWLRSDACHGHGIVHQNAIWKRHSSTPKFSISQLHRLSAGTDHNAFNHPIERFAIDLHGDTTNGVRRPVKDFRHAVPSLRSGRRRGSAERQREDKAPRAYWRQFGPSLSLLRHNFVKANPLGGI
jgi:hypothetical protein